MEACRADPFVFPCRVPESSGTPVKTPDVAVHCAPAAGNEPDVELVKTRSAKLSGFAGQRQARVFPSQPSTYLCGGSVGSFHRLFAQSWLWVRAAPLRFLSENKLRRSAETTSRPCGWKPWNTICPAREITALSTWVIHWLHRNSSGWIFSACSQGLQHFMGECQDARLVCCWPMLPTGVWAVPWARLAPAVHPRVSSLTSICS